MPTDLVQSYRIDAAELPSEAVIFGCTPAMREVHGQIKRILQNDLPVLIRGESGTGKEVIAKFLHARSDRRDAPFVKVNCGAIPVSLLDSELLGYGNGGLAGATRGLVEIAAGGTLFLDEIGDLAWEQQTRLLHLLQGGQDARFGDGQTQRTSIRLVCSTNRDLEKAVERRAFREDLFYRIDVINLNLAPLRERKADIPQLCQHFLEKLARKFDREAPPLSAGALQILTQWNWPGNLRELENRIARLIILGDDRALSREANRSSAQLCGEGVAPMRGGVAKDALRPATPAAVRASLLRALQANRWNRRKAAEDLNMSYRSLLYKLREAGVSQRRRSHRGSHPPKPGPA